jgi:hypothetical protein
MYILFWKTFFAVVWVARWYIFKPKIPIWVNFGEGLAMVDVGTFYGRLVYFMAI